MFSFGLACVGEADASRELMEHARGKLSTGKDGAHTFLCAGYCYRITHALEGKRHAGLLPQTLMDSLKEMETLDVYVIDRLRKHSRILEPDQRIDPYRRWGERISELERHLGELPDRTDETELTNRVGTLLDSLPAGYDSPRWRSLEVALQLAPRVGANFANEMLDRALPAYDALPEPTNIDSLQAQAQFLEKALCAAVHCNRREHIHSLVARSERLLQTHLRGSAAVALEALAGQCFRALRQFGTREESDRILTEVCEFILSGRDLSAVDVTALPGLLRVAAEWYYLGRDTQAESVVQAARTMLQGELKPTDQTRLACAYARTVGEAPVAVAQKRLEEIFTSVEGVKDLYVTITHYSITQLDLIEAVVFAAVAASRRTV
jgi:hypothetical protein